MIKKLYLLALGMIMAANISFGQATSTYGALAVNGTNLVDESGNPVRLQGMSLFWSNWDDGYNFWTEGVVTKLKNDWCINVIRAAMGVDEQNGYISQPTTNLNRVRTIIDAAIANDIYVIVDYHSHYAHNYKSQAITFFETIANEYKDYDNIIYEVYNEPLNVSWSGVIKPYCEDVIDAIRAIDPDNVIICGNRQWDQRPDECADDPITGEINIAYALHYYAGTHGATERAYAQDAIDGGLCLFVSEWGTVNADGNGSVNTTSSDEWFTFLENNNLSHCNWSVSNKNEGASILQPSVTDYTGASWNASSYTTSGTYVKAYLNANCPNYGTAAPTITKDVEDTEVFDGYDATFYVFASGGSLTYQWYNDNGIIGGATSNSYTVSGATTSDEMDYWVEITNSQGSVTSAKGALTISATTPYNGDPVLISSTTTTRVNIEEFDVGNNYASNTSGASYNDAIPGNDIPPGEGNGPSTVRSSDAPDADISTTWDSGNQYIISRNSAGEWWNYTVEVEAAGYYNIEIRCIAGLSGNQINLEFDGSDVTGTLNVPVDAAYYPLQGLDVTNVQLDAGVQIMRLNMLAGDASNISDIIFTPSSDVDCAGVLFGSASIDNCGVCAGGTTGTTPNTLCSQDCNGDWGGDAYTDACSICVGGNTGLTECAADCNGDLGGTAYLDGCDICVGGNTGLTECVTSIDGGFDVPQIAIVPNPTAGVFTIENAGGTSYEISNVLGQVVKAGSAVTVNLSGFDSGVYFVKFASGELIKVIKN